MVAFLSPEWIRALDEAARASTSLAAATAEAHLVVEQVVTDGGLDGGPVTWHVTLDHGATRVDAGPAPSPDVSFRQDRATALAIARGELSAQVAFMSGKLQVGHDLTKLLAHREAFSRLDDVFASVRAVTDELAPAGGRA